MSHKRSEQQVIRGSMHNGDDIGRVMRPAIPRDDLRASFAGRENKGVRGKVGASRSTHLKNRKSSNRANRSHG